MKRTIVALASFVLAATMAFAQDFNAAVEVYNAGATALNEDNKTAALESFRQALPLLEACSEEEAAEMVATCKDMIPNILYAIANDKVKAEAFDEAIATYKEAQAVATEYGKEEMAAKAGAQVPNALLAKGNHLLNAKDFAGAVEALKEGVALDSENGKANLLLGMALMQGGDVDASIEPLEKAFSLGEEGTAGKLLSNAFLKKGQALLKAGNNAGAVEALEKSNSYKESGNAYKLMGSAYTKLGKSKDAIAAYKKYLEVTPNAKDAADMNLTIAATAQKSGDKATAVEYYKKLAGTKHAATAEAQLKTLQ